MDEISEVAQRLREAPGLTSGGGVTDFEIREAEAQIGAFPSDYRYFLRHFGWASFDGFEISGLGEAPYAHLDVVRVTLRERASGGLSDSMVTFFNDGGGNLYCVRTGTNPDDDPAVYCLDHEQRLLTKEAPSFGAFLAELISEID